VVDPKEMPLRKLQLVQEAQRLRLQSSSRFHMDNEEDTSVATVSSRDGNKKLRFCSCRRLITKSDVREVRADRYAIELLYKTLQLSQAERRRPGGEVSSTSLV
jgi:hypothetical protein